MTRVLFVGRAPDTVDDRDTAWPPRFNTEKIQRICLLLATLVPFVSSVPAGAATMAPSVMRGTLALYVKAHPYAMVAVGSIDRGREWIYFVRGSQAKGRLDERTQFQIGSITKVFTATLLAQMVAARKMKLSDPIERYLPAGVAAPTYGGRPITLLSLANHTSGLPFVPPNYGSIRSPEDYSLTSLDDALVATELPHAPGSQWEYSDFGYAVLGQVIADAAHKPFGDLVKQNILVPLGMSDTVVTGSSATRHAMAPPHEYGGAPTQPAVFGRAVDPAVSIESDLHDMMVFLRANLRAPDGRLGPELSLAQQQRTRVPEWNMAMGLGWQTVLPQTHRIPGDPGDLPAGWLEKGGKTDGFASEIALNHDSNSGFVAMTNVSDDDFQQVIEHAVSPRTARLPVLWALAKRESSPLSGTYVTDINGERGAFFILKYDGDLYVSLGPGALPARLAPLGGNRYFWDGPKVTFTFNADRSGHVTSVSLLQDGKKTQAKRTR
jgi:CubicO group peptidase (beta-lactamase class C family)